MNRKTFARTFKTAFKQQNFHNYKIYAAQSNRSYIKLIHKMVRNDCDIILGLFTTPECSVAAPLLKKNKIFGISSGCANNRLKEYKPYLYTATPSLKNYMDKVASYLNNTNGLGKIYIIYQPANIYDVQQLKELKKLLEKPYKKITVSPEIVFNLDQLKDTNNKKQTFVFLTYPLPSARILLSMSSKKVINSKTNLIGSPSWPFFPTVFQPMRSLLKKARKVLTPSILKTSQITSSDFAKKFFAKYQRKPLIIEAITYYVAKKTTHCYKKAIVEHNFKRKRFNNCFSNKMKSTDYPIEFDSSSVFAHNSVNMVNFLKVINNGD